MKLSSINTLNRIASRSFATVQSIQPRRPPTIPIMTTMTETTTFPTRRCLPAVMMRAGTSKGLFIHQKDLPVSQSEWAKPLLAVMGSQGNDARQLDGVGGATSTTSKVAVIAPSSRPGIDVDYTFVQVAVGQEVVDFSGNCGNIASGVGPFAVLEGLVKPKRAGDKTMDVSIFNTNTSRKLISTVHLNPDGSFQETGTCLIPGVKTPSSEVKVAFVEPAGSMTGVLFPSGQRSQILPVPQRHSPFFSVRATLVDAANPFVLVHAGSLPHYLRNCDIDSQNYLDHMEAIRRSGAVAMGLAKTIEEAAKVRGTPKLALVEPAQQGSDASVSLKKKLRVQAFSMGKPHPSLQLTGAVCIASATCIEGTVAHQVATAKDTSADMELLLPTPQRTPSPASDRSGSEACSHSLEQVCIEHRAGSIDVDVDLERDYDDDKVTVNKCVVVRTARQLFKGYVFYYA